MEKKTREVIRIGKRFIEPDEIVPWPHIIVRILTAIFILIYCFALLGWLTTAVLKYTNAIGPIGIWSIVFPILTIVGIAGGVIGFWLDDWLDEKEAVVSPQANSPVLH